MKFRQFLSSLPVIFALANPVQAETLADVLADGYQNSGLLEQNRALLRAADEDVAQSIAALRPIVNWSANYTWRDSDIASVGADPVSANLEISADLLLYDGGASEYRTEAAKALVLQTRQDLLGIEQDVLLRIITAYMNVERNSQFVDLRKSNVRLIDEELRAARDRFEVGEITRTDVSLAEARQAAAQSALAAAEGALAQSLEEFQAAVGRRPENLEIVSPAPVERSLEEARAFALRNHHSIKSAQQSVMAAELTIRSTEASLRPSLSFRASASITSGGNASQRVGLSVSGPIYRGGQLESAIRQAVAGRDASRASLLVVGRSVEQNVGNAYAQLRVAQSSRQASQLQIRAAETALNGVREEAMLGARTTLDVLNAEQEFLDARANAISAQADEVIASYQVLAAMGILTAAHLNLSVPTYDPSAYYNLIRNAPSTYSDQGRALSRVLQSIGN